MTRGSSVRDTLLPLTHEHVHATRDHTLKKKITPNRVAFECGSLRFVFNVLRAFFARVFGGKRVSRGVKLVANRLAS